jgi:heme-degrading monooxygenase HmoA
MYARVNVIEVKPGTMDEAATFWESVMLPILDQQPGFKGTLLLGDRAADRIIVTSFWETEDTLHAWTTRNTAQEQHVQIEHVLVSQTREDYEVLVRHEPSPSGDRR